MDDEQGPWWTRPPEPGPQARNGEQWRDHPYMEALQEHAGETEPVDRWVPSQARSSESTTPQPEAPSAPPPAPEPEPEPAPPPRRQAIRRVAVVPPPAPPTSTTDPGHGYGHDEGGPTETLPAVGVGGNDDIFAVFGDDSARSGAGLGYRQPDDPLAPLREDSDHPHRHLPPLPHVAAGRMPLILAVAGLVVVLVILVVLIGPLSGNKSGSATATRTSATAPTKGPLATLTGTPPSGLTQVSDAQAADLLRKAGQQPGGTIAQAWGWTDRNGQNLVVDSMERRHGKEDLRVTHVAQLNGDKPEVLRVMRDPGLPAGCKSGTAGFTPGGTSVRDLNGDGVAEVAVGWSSRCGGAASRSVVKLALITNGDKFIIRGDGVVGHAGEGTTRPDPGPSSWPKDYLAQLTMIFRKLYF